MRDENNEEGGWPAIGWEQVNGATFRKTNFSIDGKILRGCTFIDCHLIYGGGFFDLLNCKFDSCFLTIVEPALNADSTPEAMASTCEQMAKNVSMLQSYLFPKQRPLFKYMKREHALALVKEGSLRIGSLYDFRKSEHGPEIGDKEEGLQISEGEVTYTKEAGELASPILGRAIVPSRGAKVVLTNCVLRDEDQSADLLIFCMTLVATGKALKEFGYDTCVVIHDPLAFFRHVTESLGAGVEFQGVHGCVYKPRTRGRGVPLDVFPALGKDPRYAYQKEARALWCKSGSVPRYVDIKDSNLVRYCAIHEIEDEP